MRLVNIGNHTWAVGLNWVKYRDKRKRYADLKNEVAPTPDGTMPDMVTFRPRQYGFGEAGERQSIYRTSNPLAGGIEIMSTSFLGVFYLQDTDDNGFWWVFAIKNGLISANGEVVCATREEAEAKVVELHDLLGEFEENVLCETWDGSAAAGPSSLERLVLGESWSEHGSSERPSSLEWLEPLLTYRRSSRLHLLKNIYQRRRRYLISGVAAAICLTGGLALSSILTNRNEERAVREMQLASQVRLQQKADLLAHPEREFFKPWVTAMPVPDVVQRCIGTMLALPTVASGWSLESAICDGHKVDVSWKFEPGSDYLALPPQAFLISPQKAVSTIRLAEFAPQKQEQDDHNLLSSRSVVSRHFYQLTQNMGALLALKFRPQEKKTLSKADKQEIVAPWQRGEWELSGVPAALMFDTSLALALSMPGMILQKVEYAGDWSFKGEIYVLPR